MFSEQLNTANMRSRSFGALGWMLSSKFVTIAANLVSIAILARLLSPADFGTVGVLMSIAVLAQVIAGWGMWNAIIQMPRIEDRHISTLMAVMFAAAATLAVALYFAGATLEEIFAAPGLAILTPAASAIILLETLILFGDALLRRQHKFKLIALRDTAAIVLVQLPLAIAFAYTGHGPASLMYGYMARGVVVLVACFFFAKFPLVPRIDRQAFLDLFRFGKWVGMGHLFVFLSQNGDNLVVGRLLGVEALGIYGRAFQLINYPVNILGSSVKSIMFPMVSAIQSDLPRVKRAYLDGYRAIFAISAGSSAVVIFVLPETVNLLLGPQWNAVVPIAQLLAASLSIRVALKYLESIPLALGEARSATVRDVTNGSCTVFAAVAAAPFGIAEVAAAVSAVAVAIHLYAAGLANSSTQTRWTEFGEAHLPGFCAFIALAVSGAAAQHFSTYLSLATLPSLGLKLSFAAAATGLLLGFAGRWILGPTYFVARLQTRRTFDRLTRRRRHSGDDEAGSNK